MADAIRFLTMPSPVGDLTLAARATGLACVYFARHQHAPPWREQTRWTPDHDESNPESILLARARDQLNAYFDGVLTVFDLPLAAEGTPFQRQVWAELRRIPFGSTSSYGAVARSLGRPSAARAVGAANGRNPIPIIVPCHRVIGANGSLTGFGGGMERKRWLLNHERRYEGRTVGR